ATRLGAGWSVPLEDTLGEFQLRVWLGQAPAGGTVTANDAAAGWGGDRFAGVKGPNGSWALGVRAGWGNPADAAQFEAAAKPVVDGLKNPASLLPGAGGTERWVLVASDDATLGKVANVLGLAG